MTTTTPQTEQRETSVGAVFRLAWPVMVSMLYALWLCIQCYAPSFRAPQKAL